MVRLNMRAFTLVEVIFVLFLINIVFLLAFPSLKLSYVNFNTLQTKEFTLNKQNSVIQAIKSSAKTSNALFGVDTIVVHPLGEIRTSNGLLDQVHLRSPAMRPDENSNAVSFLELRPELVLRITEQTNSTPIRFQLCLENKVPPANFLQDLRSSTKYWLAVSVDGVVWLSGNAIRINSNSNHCLNGIEFTGEFSKVHEEKIFHTSTSFVDTGLELSEKNSLVLIPVSDAYTIYLDASKTLRRLSDLNSENQPIIRDIDKITVELENKSNKKISVNVSVENFFTKKTTSKEYIFSKQVNSPINLLHLISP
jgi:type II secretory pathway pseudopilin PulG